MLAVQGKARPLPTYKANLPPPQRVEMHGYSKSTIICREHETSDIFYPMRLSLTARKETNGPLEMLSLVYRIRRRSSGRMK